jgi:hypothetical protein
VTAAPPPAPGRADPRLVGPVLASGPVSEAIVEAVRDVTPGLVVRDEGAYVRLLAPGECRMPASLVSIYLGRSFVLPGDLEAVMVSFRGRLAMVGGEASWRDEEAP